MTQGHTWTIVNQYEGRSFVAHFDYKESAETWAKHLRRLGADKLALYKDAWRNGEPVKTWGAFDKGADW